MTAGENEGWEKENWFLVLNSSLAMIQTCSDTDALVMYKIHDPTTDVLET